MNIKQLTKEIQTRIIGYEGTLKWVIENHDSQSNKEVIESRIAAYKDILNLIDEKT